MPLLIELLVAVVIIGAGALWTVNMRSNSTEGGSAGNDERQQFQNSTFSATSNVNQNSQKKVCSDDRQPAGNTKKTFSRFDPPGDGGIVRQKKVVSQFRSDNANGISTRQTPRLQNEFNIGLHWSKNLENLLEEDEKNYVAEEDLTLECAGMSEEDRLRRYVDLFAKSKSASTRWYRKVSEVMEQIESVGAQIGQLGDNNSLWRQLVDVKRKLQTIKDLMNNRKKAFLEQKGMIENKIKNECGNAGKKWLQLQEERNNIKKNNRKATI